MLLTRHKSSFRENLSRKTGSSTAVCGQLPWELVICSLDASTGTTSKNDVHALQGNAWTQSMAAVEDHKPHVRAQAEESQTLMSKRGTGSKIPSRKHELVEVIYNCTASQRRDDPVESTRCCKIASILAKPNRHLGSNALLLLLVMLTSANDERVLSIPAKHRTSVLSRTTHCPSSAPVRRGWTLSSFPMVALIKATCS